MADGGAVPITVLSGLVGQIVRLECAKAGVPYETPVQFALASGLDTTLTIMEESVGVYRGLDASVVEKIVAYFRAEAKRSRSVDQQIAFWYDAWATVLQAHIEQPAPNRIT